MSPRVALIVNPTSGKGAGRRLGDETRRLLLERGCDVVEVSDVSYAAGLDRARAVVAEGVEVLAVVGGDGMMHLGVNACAGTATALAVVAAGSGNDFARNLDLPTRDPAASVAMIVAGHTTRVDVGRVRAVTEPHEAATDHDSSQPGEAKWFGGVLGAGFDAVVNARAARMRWPKGQMRYNLAILRELPVFRPIPYVVELDGRRVETKAMLVAVANTTSFGGGMKVCPDADVTDGLFDVLILHEVSIPTFLRVFPTVYRGAHVNHPAVEIHRATRVRLEASGILSQADGETFARLPIEAEVVAAGLTVVVPGPAQVGGRGAGA